MRSSETAASIFYPPPNSCSAPLGVFDHNVSSVALIALPQWCLDGNRMAQARPTGLAQCSGPVDPVDDGVRKRVLAAIERIVNAEAEASGALRNPEITTLDPVGCSAEAIVSTHHQQIRAHT